RKGFPAAPKASALEKAVAALFVSPAPAAAGLIGGMDAPAAGLGFEFFEGGEGAAPGSGASRSPAPAGGALYGRAFRERIPCGGVPFKGFLEACCEGAVASGTAGEGEGADDGEGFFPLSCGNAALEAFFGAVEAGRRQALFEYRERGWREPVQQALVDAYAPALFRGKCRLEFGGEREAVGVEAGGCQGRDAGPAVEGLESFPQLDANTARLEGRRLLGIADKEVFARRLESLGALAAAGVGGVGGLEAVYGPLRGEALEDELAGNV